MSYHQFLTIQTLLNKVMVSNTFKQHCAYIGVILYKQCVPKWVIISLTLFGLNLTYEPTIHIREM